MRITNRVSGAGHNGLVRLIDLGIGSIDADLCAPDGSLDEAKCRRVLNRPDFGIQINSDDGIPEFAFALELLNQTRNVTERMIGERRGDSTKEAHGSAECADDRHAERNMDRGKFVFVRIDITYKTSIGPNGGIRLAVNVDNPREIVGRAWTIAVDYALIVARIANSIADQMTAAHGRWSYEFVGGPGCPTLFQDARKIDAELKRKAEIREANVAMWKCERRTASGHCSPICPSCRHYVSGKCVEINEGERQCR